MSILGRRIWTLIAFAIPLLSVAPSPASATTFATHTITTAANGGSSVYAVDLDGDSDMDVLSASGNDDKVAWYENDGSENFTPHTITTTTDGARSVYAVDLDGDLDIDVLSASFNDNTIAWYENDGNENFTPHTITTGALGARSVYAVDVDGDLDIDVLSASFNDNKVAWYENDGNENFTPHTLTTTAMGAYSVYAVDVDGDLDIDVLSASFNDNKVAWYENDGSENFTPHTITTATTGAASVYAVDVDGDSDMDLFSASVGDNKLAWYENDGSENFTPYTITTAAIGCNSVYAVDVDGDLDVDVLSASTYDHKVAWYENDGGENFTAHTITTVAGGVQSVYAQDVDGDSNMDVLSASSSDDRVAWYENDDATPSTLALHPTGDGATVEFTTSGCAGAWDCANDQIGNGGSGPPEPYDPLTYLTGANGQRVMFSLDDGLVPAGATVTSITIRAQVYRGGGSGAGVRLSYQRMTGATTPDATPVGGPSFDLSTSCCSEISTTWSDGNWTSDDLDNLEIGAIQNSGNSSSYITQLYVVVSYVTGGATNVVVVETTSDVADAPGFGTPALTISALIANRGADNAISLREAIDACNNTPNGAGPDSIHFDIPGSDLGIQINGTDSWWRISPDSALPWLENEAVVIDGATQTANQGNTNTLGPEIELFGQGAGAGIDGLRVATNSCTIRGLIIAAFTDDAIELAGSSNIIAGNYLGTNFSGSDPQSNGDCGIEGVGSNNVIGGSTVTDRNLISGNGGHGVRLNGGNTNSIFGNYIGVARNGVGQLGNANNGIWINTSSNNAIGSSAPGTGNVIADNGISGVLLFHATSTGNTIEGNHIGVDAPGTGTLPNGTNGISIFSGATGTIIGGQTPGSRNVIAGNTDAGISISGSDGNTVRGNYIGTDASGTAGLPNDNGVYITSGAANNSVGGRLVADANLIAFNSYSGVSVVGASPGNTVQQNWLHSNASLGMVGIDLGGDGVTPNNGTKNAAQPNNDMDYPVVTSTLLSGTMLYLSGYVGSAPGQSLFAGARVEFFESLPDGSGHGQGISFLDSLTTDANGNFAGAIDVAGKGIVVTDKITATATDGNGNTSEYALDAVVALWSAEHVVWVTTTRDSLDGDTSSILALSADPGADLRVSLREAITAANNTPNGAGEPDSIRFAIPADDAGHFYYPDDGVPGSLDRLLLATTTASDDASIPDADPDFQRSWWSIPLLGALPSVTDTLVIDGSSQAGYVDSPIIELDGTAMGGSFDGVQISAGASTVHGLVVNRCTHDGIQLDTVGGNRVVGCYVGTDASGTLDLGNNVGGLRIYSAGNTLGGTANSDRNVIAGNGSVDVYVGSASATANTIENNFIGVDASGARALPSGAWGVMITSDADSNTVGGIGAASSNVIAGSSYGIHINGVGTSANNVWGNYIGTDVTGSLPLGGINGVEIGSGASNNLVGGATTEMRNLISGNNIGVHISDSSSQNNYIRGNYIGTDVTGLLDLGNNSHGIWIEADLNFIGGNAPGEGNLIAGNNGNGIRLSDASGNKVAGNTIGADVTGAGSLGNGGAGVLLNANSQNNVIGGTVTGSGNVISGNGDAGIYVLGAGVTGTIIQGNIVGLDAAGDGLLGNGNDGITLESASGVQVGGTEPGSGNVLSGNLDPGNISDGLWITGGGNHTVQGNWFGTDTTGTLDRGNYNAGITLTSTSGNLIGGTAPGAGNLIAYNGNAGVKLVSGGTDNSILGNSIRDAGGLGVDLGDDGLTGNDPGDADSGPNDRRNFPVIAAATAGSDTVDVDFDLDVPAGDYRIEFFKNPGGVDATHGEGEVFASALTITHTGSGLESFNHRFAGTPSDTLTATTTDSLLAGGYGSTSEFSAWHPVTPASVYQISGRVFEDALITAGVGESFNSGEGDTGLSGARIELFDASNVFQSFTTTDGSGDYTFANLDGGANYRVRVVAATLDVGVGALPEQTFESDGSADYGTFGVAMGGQDALAADTTGQSTMTGAEHWVAVNVGTADVTGVDFGFSYELVVNSRDAGQGTFRSFLDNSNAIPGVQTSRFNIPATDPNYTASPLAFVIQPLSPLPEITDTTIVDGTTQPDFTTTPIIVLDGAQAGAGVSGLRISGGASTVRGLVIHRFTVSGIHVTIGGGNVIEGNYIGVDVTGLLDRGNGAHGIHIDSDTGDNTIGGVTMAERNLISGNGANGIYLQASSANSVFGNYIGTDKNGAPSLGNVGHGVLIDVGDDNVIGGTAPGERNLIIGNLGSGVAVTG